MHHDPVRASCHALNRRRQTHFRGPIHVAATSARMRGRGTTTEAPAGTTVPDAAIAALAAGHAPDSLAVHTARMGPAELEPPMTVAEAADEDWFLTAVVEVSIIDMTESRADEEAGADCPTATGTFCRPCADQGPMYSPVV